MNTTKETNWQQLYYETSVALYHLLMELPRYMPTDEVLSLLEDNDHFDNPDIREAYDDLKCS